MIDTDSYLKRVFTDWVQVAYTLKPFLLKMVKCGKSSCRIAPERWNFTGFSQSAKEGRVYTPLYFQKEELRRMLTLFYRFHARVQARNERKQKRAKVTVPVILHIFGETKGRFTRIYRNLRKTQGHFPALSIKHLLEPQ